jgi:hypothetical protein
MLTEFEALPDVISGASDFAAIFGIESLLKFLRTHDCADLEKFRVEALNFPHAASTSLIRESKDVQVIKRKFAKDFWVSSGKEFAKKLLAKSSTRCPSKH